MNEHLQRLMDEGTTSRRTNEHGAFTRCENWKPVITAAHGYGHPFRSGVVCDHLAWLGMPNSSWPIRLGLPTASFLPRTRASGLRPLAAMTGRRFSAEEAWTAAS
jgi:hypothetical protein